MKKSVKIIISVLAIVLICAISFDVLLVVSAVLVDGSIVVVTSMFDTDALELSSFELDAVEYSNVENNNHKTASITIMTFLAFDVTVFPTNMKIIPINENKTNNTIVSIFLNSIFP